MGVEQRERRTSRFRTGRILALVALLIGLGFGGRWFYYYQRDRNTQRLETEAEQAYAKEDWAAAAESYRQFLNRDPFHAEALRRYADILLDRTEPTPQSVTEAARALRRLLQVDANDLDAIGKLTRIYFGLGEFDLGQQMAQRWVEVAPDDVDAILALSEAHKRQHRFEESASILVEALSRNPREPRLYPRLVELYMTDLKDPQQARQWLERGLTEAPNAAVVQMAAFSLYRMQKEPETAERYLRQALSLAPDELSHLVAGAGFYIEQLRLDEAEKLLDRARAVDPKDRRLLLAEAAWSVKRGTPEALTTAASALSTYARDTDAELIAQAAELFVRAGAFDKTDACLARLRPLARRDERTQTWIEILEGARALLAGATFESIPHLERALRRNAGHLWTTELLALAYTRIGALDEAAELYRRVTILTPGSAAAHLSLARIAWQQGDPEGAMEHLDAIGTLHTKEQRIHRELLAAVCQLELLARAGGSTDDGHRQTLLAQLRKLASAAPADPFAAELLATGYVRAGAVDEAAALAANVSASAAVQIANVLAAAGSWSHVKDIADDLTRTPETAADGYMLTVRQMIATDRTDEVTSYVDALAVPDTVKGRVFAVAADAMIDQHDTDAATSLLRRAVTLSLRDIPVRQNLLRRITDPTEAQRLIDQIKAIEGEDGLHWRYERAAFLTRTDPTEPALREAVALLQDCLAARPGWTSALLVRGYAQESLGELENAADSYRTAISQQPRLGRGDIAIRLVGVLKKLNRFAEADALVASLAESQSHQPEVLRLETERYLRHRRLASAAQTAEELLSVNPDDPNWAAFTADLQRRAGNAARAEQIAREALKQHEPSVALLWSLARALVEQKRPDEAVEVIRASATRRNDANQFLVLAQLQFRLGRQEDATGSIQQALAIAPEDALVNGAAADFWGAMGDRAQQLAYARKSIALRGEDPARSLTLATLLAAGTDPQEQAEAHAIVHRRLEQNEDDVPALILEAKIVAAAQPPDLRHAEESLQKALTLEPRSEPAHKVLAAVQARSGRFREARETIEAGLTVAPNDPDLLKSAAELHIHRGEFASAIAPLDRLLELGLATPETLVLLAQAYRADNQLDRAIKLLQKRVDADSATPLELATLAELVETTADFDRAESLFLGGVERAGADGTIFQRFMNYLARRDQLDRVYALASQRQQRFADDVESIAVAAEILASRAEDPELRKTGQTWLSDIIARRPAHAADAAFRSGLSYYKRGELVNAETMLMKAAQLAPNAPRPVNGLAWLYLADRHRPEEALGMLERFFERGGQPNAEMLDTHAAILLRLDRLTEARELLTRCLTLAGQTPTLTAANYRMGRVLLKLGQQAEAVTYLRHALELNQRLPGLLPQEVQEAQSLVTR